MLCVRLHKHKWSAAPLAVSTLNIVASAAADTVASAAAAAETALHSSMLIATMALPVMRQIKTLNSRNLLDSLSQGPSLAEALLEC